MPILLKCAQCRRVGGYAEKTEDKVCARCKNKQKPKTKELKTEEDMQ